MRSSTEWIVAASAEPDFELASSLPTLTDAELRESVDRIAWTGRHLKEFVGGRKSLPGFVACRESGGLLGANHLYYWGFKQLTDDNLKFEVDSPKLLQIASLRRAQVWQRHLESKDLHAFAVELFGAMFPKWKSCVSELAPGVIFFRFPVHGHYDKEQTGIELSLGTDGEFELESNLVGSLALTGHLSALELGSLEIVLDRHPAIRVSVSGMAGKIAIDPMATDRETQESLNGFVVVTSIVLFLESLILFASKAGIAAPVTKLPYFVERGSVLLGREVEAKVAKIYASTIVANIVICAVGMVALLIGGIMLTGWFVSRDVGARSLWIPAIIAIPIGVALAAYSFYNLPWAKRFTAAIDDEFPLDSPDRSVVESLLQGKYASWIKGISTESSDAK